MQTPHGSALTVFGTMADTAGTVPATGVTSGNKRQAQKIRVAMRVQLPEIARARHEIVVPARRRHWTLPVLGIASPASCL